MQQLVGTSGEVTAALQLDHPKEVEAGEDAIVVEKMGVVHPHDMLMTKLKRTKKEAAACMGCAGEVYFYCQSCILAVYCSAACQLHHWEGGHGEECGTWAAGLNSGAGLLPPLPVESKALHATGLH